MARAGLNLVFDDNSKCEKYVRFRTVPFGHPLTRDNESHNPGRQRYTSISTRSFMKSEAFSMFWLDSFRNSSINQRTDWQSGPPDNNSLSDYVVDGAGFWTAPGAASADWDNVYGAGDPHKMAGCSALTKNKDLTMLYGVGIGQRNSGTNEGMEYGVVGMSGYFKPDWDSRDATTKSTSNIGLKRAYVIWRCDALDEDFDNIGDIIAEIIMGSNDVFSVGVRMFPQYLSGKIEIDEENGGFKGYSVNFPENFDVAQHFIDNQIDFNNIIQESGLIDKLKSRKIKNNINSINILDAFVESWNIELNKQRGVTGAHNFTINPSVLSDKLRNKNDFSCLDIFNFVFEMLVQKKVMEMMPGGFDLESILKSTYTNNGGVTPDEIRVAMRTEDVGGELEFNEATQRWEGILPEDYNVDRLTPDHAHRPLIQQGSSALLHIGDPYSAVINAETQFDGIPAIPSVDGFDPDWLSYNDIPTWDMDDVGWVDGIKPDRIKIRNWGHHVLRVYGSDQPNGTNWHLVTQIPKDRTKAFIIRDGRNRRYLRVCPALGPNDDFKNGNPFEHTVHFEFEAHLTEDGKRRREGEDDQPVVFNQVSTYRGVAPSSKGKAQTPCPPMSRSMKVKLYPTTADATPVSWGNYENVYTIDMHQVVGFNEADNFSPATGTWFSIKNNHSSKKIVVYGCNDKDTKGTGTRGDQWKKFGTIDPGKYSVCFNITRPHERRYLRIGVVVGSASNVTAWKPDSTAGQTTIEFNTEGNRGTGGAYKVQLCSGSTKLTGNPGPPQEIIPPGTTGGGNVDINCTAPSEKVTLYGATYRQKVGTGYVKVPEWDRYYESDRVGRAMEKNKKYKITNPYQNTMAVRILWSNDRQAINDTQWVSTNVIQRGQTLDLQQGAPANYLHFCDYNVDTQESKNWEPKGKPICMTIAIEQTTPPGQSRCGDKKWETKLYDAHVKIQNVGLEQDIQGNREQILVPDWGQYGPTGSGGYRQMVRGEFNRNRGLKVKNPSSNPHPIRLLFVNDPNSLVGQNLGVVPYTSTEIVLQPGEEHTYTKAPGRYFIPCDYGVPYSTGVTWRPEGSSGAMNGLPICVEYQTIAAPSPPDNGNNTPNNGNNTPGGNVTVPGGNIPNLPNRPDTPDPPNDGTKTCPDDLYVGYLYPSVVRVPILGQNLPAPVVTDYPTGYWYADLGRSGRKIRVKIQDPLVTDKNLRIYTSREDTFQDFASVHEINNVGEIDITAAGKYLLIGTRDYINSLAAGSYNPNGKPICVKIGDPLNPNTKIPFIKKVPPPSGNVPPNNGNLDRCPQGFTLQKAYYGGTTGNSIKPEDYTQLQVITNLPTDRQASFQLSSDSAFDVKILYSDDRPFTNRTQWKVGGTIRRNGSLREVPKASRAVLASINATATDAQFKQANGINICLATVNEPPNNGNNTPGGNVTVPGGNNTPPGNYPLKTCKEPNHKIGYLLASTKSTTVGVTPIHRPEVNTYTAFHYYDMGKANTNIEVSVNDPAVSDKEIRIFTASDLLFTNIRSQTTCKNVGTTTHTAKGRYIIIGTSSRITGTSNLNKYKPEGKQICVKLNERGKPNNPITPKRKVPTGGGNNTPGGNVTIPGGNIPNVPNNNIPGPPNDGSHVHDSCGGCVTFNGTVYIYGGMHTYCGESTNNITINNNSGGGPGGNNIIIGPDGNRPDGNLPNLPDGNRPDGNLPNIPDGNRPNLPDGNLPNIPDGNRPNLPDGNLPNLPGGNVTVPGGNLPNLPGSTGPLGPGSGRCSVGYREETLFDGNFETDNITVPNGVMMPFWADYPNAPYVNQTRQPTGFTPLDVITFKTQRDAGYRVRLCWTNDRRPTDTTTWVDVNDILRPGVEQNVVVPARYCFLVNADESDENFSPDGVPVCLSYDPTEPGGGGGSNRPGGNVTVPGQGGDGPIFGPPTKTCPDNFSVAYLLPSTEIKPTDPGFGGNVAVPKVSDFDSYYYFDFGQDGRNITFTFNDPTASETRVRIITCKDLYFNQIASHTTIDNQGPGRGHVCAGRYVIVGTSNKVNGPTNSYKPVGTPICIRARGGNTDYEQIRKNNIERPEDTVIGGSGRCPAGYQAQTLYDNTVPLTYQSQQIGMPRWAEYTTPLSYINKSAVGTDGLKANSVYVVRSHRTNSHRIRFAFANTATPNANTDWVDLTQTIEPGKEQTVAVPTKYCFLIADGVDSAVSGQWPPDGYQVCMDFTAMGGGPQPNPDADDFETECIEVGGTIAKAYYDDWSHQNPSFSNNHYAGTSNRNRPKVEYLQRDSNNRKFEEGLKYEIGLTDIEDRDRNASDQFSAIRVWWSNSNTPEGPFTLSGDESVGQGGRSQGVIYPGQFKTLTCKGKYMFIGGVDHYLGDPISQWPREGTRVCVHSELGSGQQRPDRDDTQEGVGGPGVVPPTLGPDSFGNSCDKRGGLMYYSYWDDDKQKHQPGFKNSYYTGPENRNNPKLLRVTRTWDGGAITKGEKYVFKLYGIESSDSGPTGPAPGNTRPPAPPGVTQPDSLDWLDNLEPGGVPGLPANKNKNKNGTGKAMVDDIDGLEYSLPGATGPIFDSFYTPEGFATEEDVATFKKGKIPGKTGKVPGNKNKGGITGKNKNKGNTGPDGGGGNIGTTGATGATRPQGATRPDGATRPEVGEDIGIGTRDPYDYRGVRIWFSENPDGSTYDPYNLAGAKDGESKKSNQGIVMLGQSKVYTATDSGLYFGAVLFENDVKIKDFPQKGRRICMRIDKYDPNNPPESRPELPALPDNDRDINPLIPILIGIGLSQIPGFDIISTIAGWISGIRNQRKTDFIGEMVETSPINELPTAGDVENPASDKDILHRPNNDSLFFSGVVKERTRLLSRIFRMRHNGFLFHVLPGESGGAAGTIKVLRFHNLAPIYAFGSKTLDNHDAHKVLRQWYPTPNANGRLGVPYDTVFKIDTRHDRIREHVVGLAGVNNKINEGWWEGQWWYPITSHCPRSYHQDFIYTKGGTKYYNGDVGDNANPRSKISGIDDTTDDFSREFLKIFTRHGSGTKLYDYYSGSTSYHSWSWEMLAGQPSEWPMDIPDEGAYPLFQLDIRCRRFTSKDSAVINWQPVMMHATFEDEFGGLQSIKMINKRNTKCIWRDTFDFGYGEAVPTHVMDQWLPNDSLRFVLEGHKMILPGWKFWGFAMSTWIGEAGGAKRTRCFTINNMKPGLKYADDWGSTEIMQKNTIYTSYSDYYFKEVYPKVLSELEGDIFNSQFSLPDEPSNRFTLPASVEPVTIIQPEVAQVEITPTPEPVAAPVATPVPEPTPEPTPDPSPSTDYGSGYGY